MMFDDTSTTLGGVHMDTLFGITERRGCLTGRRGVWAESHALAHLTLGHLVSPWFSLQAEDAADVAAWADWLALDA